MTLVELLVSVSLVILVMVFLVQVMNNTRIATDASDKLLEADSQAKMVFDRMALDFSRMVKRTDVDYVFTRQSGTGGMFFYSEAPGSFAGGVAQSVALVGYHINASSQLERLGHGLTWDGTNGVVFLCYPTYPVTSSSASSPSVQADFNSTIPGAFPETVSFSGSSGPGGSSGPNYHVLSQDVFRIEYCFLLNPCTQNDGTTRPAIYSNNPWDTRAGHGSLLGIGLSDVQAIIVAIAILDESSRNIIQTQTQLNGLNTLASEFLQSGTNDLNASPPVLMATKWQGVITSGSLNHLSLPQAAVNRVRVYQHTFPIHP